MVEKFRLLIMVASPWLRGRRCDRRHAAAAAPLQATCSATLAGPLADGHPTLGKVASYQGIGWQTGVCAGARRGTGVTATRPSLLHRDGSGSILLTTFLALGRASLRPMPNPGHAADETVVA